MQARTKFWRGVSLAAMAAVALTACEGETIVNVPEQPTPPPPALNITITPAQLTLDVGQTQQVIATVTGGAEGTNRAVTFSSSNAAVATVNAQGVVTAVAPGAATIIAAAAADPNIRAGASVTVRAPATVPPSEDEDASVVIQSVTRVATTTPVDPNNVSGQIDVTLSVVRGNSDRLEVLLNGQPVPGCTQTFGAAHLPSELTAEGLSLAANQRSIVCSINTADFAVVAGQGVPTYPNATYSLSARLTRNGETLDSATGANLRFANTDVVLTTVSAPNTEIANATGLLWHGGAVTLTAVPVMYSGGSIARVDVTYTGAHGTTGAQTHTRTITLTSEGGFTHTFPATTFANHSTNPGVAWVERDGFRFTINTVRTTGQPGPSGVQTSATFRLDNPPADPGVFQYVDTTVRSNAWVNAAYDWRSAHGRLTGASGTAPVDGGVGNLVITYHAAPAADYRTGPGQTIALTAAQRSALVAAHPAITTGEALAETIDNDRYVVVARVEDGLGNVSTTQLLTPAGFYNTIGADHTPPVITGLPSVNHRDIFNAADPAAGEFFMVEFEDMATAAGAAPSGFSSEPVRMRLIRTAPGVSTAEACRRPTDVTQSQWNVNFGCLFQWTQGTIPVPDHANFRGYYTIEYQVYDQAGNFTSIESIQILVDEEAPITGNISIPGNLTGGANTTFSIIAQDNVDLGAWRFFYGFAGMHDLPFAHGSFNTAFSGTLVPTGTASATTRYIRGIQDIRDMSIYQTNEVRFDVDDAAMNQVIRRDGVSGPAFGSINPALTDFLASTPTSAQDISARASFSFVAEGPTGTFNNPFVEVHFYALDADGNLHYLGRAGSPSVTDDNVTRRWRYTGSVTPAGYPLGALTIFAVGIESDGDALRSRDLTHFTVVAP
jgi:hypothetical protein